MKKWMPLTLLGLLLTCFVANSTVLLPSSSLLIVLEFSFIMNPLSVMIIGVTGASLGELTGYMVGVKGSSLASRFRKTAKLTNFKKHSFLWVIIFAFVPFPIFDIAGILAGGIRMNPMKFYAACFIGKLTKMGVYALIAHLISSIWG